MSSLRPLVAVTMRSAAAAGRPEIRDGVQDSWWPLLEEVGVAPIMLPNHSGLAASLLGSISLGGLLLTGGDAISALSGKASARDLVEELAVAHCVGLGLPILGVCRGMQKLISLFGGGVGGVAGHVGEPHDIIGPGVARRVNTFHDHGCTRVPSGFEVRARAAGDGCPEWIENSRLRISGIMWHPERNGPHPDREDVHLLRSMFLGVSQCAA